MGDWDRKLKCTFVLNTQQAAIQTAVLLRKWGRGDKHPPTLVFLYNFSEDDKSCCSSYFFLSGSKAQTATDITRMFPTDLFFCTCVQSNLHFRPRIIFPGCNQDSTPHGFSHWPFLLHSWGPRAKSLPGLLLHSVVEDWLFWSLLLRLAHHLQVSSSTRAELVWQSL